MCSSGASIHCLATSHLLPAGYRLRESENRRTRSANRLAARTRYREPRGRALLDGPRVLLHDGRDEDGVSREEGGLFVPRGRVVSEGPDERAKHGRAEAVRLPGGGVEVGQPGVAVEDGLAQKRESRGGEGPGLATLGVDVGVGAEEGHPGAELVPANRQFLDRRAWKRGTSEGSLKKPGTSEPVKGMPPMLRPSSMGTTAAKWSQLAMLSPVQIALLRCEPTKKERERTKGR